MSFWDAKKGIFIISEIEQVVVVIFQKFRPSCIRGVKIACEGGEYICGFYFCQRYQIEDGVPNGSHIEASRILYRDTFKSAFDNDIDHEGRKITPSEIFRQMQEETGLHRRSHDSLRDFDERFEHDDFIGTAGG